MDIRRLVAIFLFSFDASSQVIEKLNLICDQSIECNILKERIQGMFPIDVESFKKNIKFVLLDNSIKTMDYEIVKGDVIEVRIYISPRMRINEITISFDKNVDIDQDSILSLIPLKENDFLDFAELEKSKEGITDFLELRGIRVEGIDVETRDFEKSVHFNIRITLGTTIDDIKINIDHASYQKDVFHYFSDLKKSGLNIVALQSRIQQYLNQIVAEGFFYARAGHTISEKNGRATVNLSFKLGTQYQFGFHGNKIVSRQQLLDVIKQEVRKNESFPMENQIVKMFVEYYENINIYESTINIRKIEGKTKFGIPFVTLHIYIHEGHKIRVNDVIYNNMASLKKEVLNDLLEQLATPLVSRGYLDKNFFKMFSSEIRKKYLERGFIFIEILDPVYVKLADGHYNVIFDIIERRQNVLRKITIEGVPRELREEMLLSMKNKEDMALNIPELEEDIELVSRMAKQKGFYFSEIVNLENGDIIKYSDSFDTSEVHIRFNLGHKSVFERVLIVGNRKTKKEVIEREIRAYQGELVTLEKIQEIENKLVSLELFSSVKLTPLVGRTDSKKGLNFVNLLVQVVERPFGVAELTPGYRTDLGPKVALDVSYNNLWGANHIITSTIQVNQRIGNTGIDVRRNATNEKMLEGLLEVRYRIPYWMIVNSPWELETDSSFSRTRFYNFDADVLEIGPRISKRFTPSFLASLRYQFESIRQFNATNSDDDDTFKVGGITPSVAFDFRDDEINPTRGTYFGLSWEFANKFFGAQEGNRTEVNYSKFISRNRFYYPMNHWVLVFSLSAGYQKNYARGSVGNDSRRGIGYIPSIKVFRLNGPDNVRGYDDSEINRLSQGLDISDLRVEDKAYFVNYKFEPRYKVSDTLMVSVFVDAGRIYVNHFKPLSVRASVGSGIKFLTPVGTLDFDYGIKLNRRSYRGGRIRESFGRFHLTVGSF